MSWRLGWPAACSALVLAAGCGESPKQAAPPPQIPHEVASALAARADAVAAALARGDACTAHGDADALSRMAGDAQLAPIFRAKLEKAVGELAASLPPCAPAPSPPAAPTKTEPPAKKRPHEKRKHGKKDHGRKHGGDQQGND